jgi:hypothetical protein
VVLDNNRDERCSSNKRLGHTFTKSMIQSHSNLKANENGELLSHCLDLRDMLGAVPIFLMVHLHRVACWSVDPFESTGRKALCDGLTSDEASGSA